LPPSVNTLLARLQLHLSKAVPGADLRRLGWPDFRYIDHPAETDAVALSAQALFYLCVDERGQWNGHLGVLSGLVAFLYAETGARPDARAMQALRRIVERAPVSRDAIDDWFDSVYPIG